MISTQLERLAHEAGGELRGASAPVTIERVCADSRGAAPGSLFIALKGERADGHAFLADAFRNGASAAMVSPDSLAGRDLDPRWPLLVVADPLRALQAIARRHRRQYFRKVVAITGSNGKTIVKDALKALLAGRRVLASPGSYNSQLGLPLAVLSAEQPEDLAILEAGVSAPGEMPTLEEIAAPDYGILTNVGMAHFAAFGSREAIAREKMSLFRNIAEDGWVLVPAEEPVIEGPLRELRCKVHRVGEFGLALRPAGHGGEKADSSAQRTGLRMTKKSAKKEGATIHSGNHLLELVADGARYPLAVRTHSPEIIADLEIAATAAYLLGVPAEEIASTLEGYAPASTRMELWSSPQGIRIINDSYSSDPISVHAALRSAARAAPEGGRKIFAFAGMRELGASSSREHRQVGEQAAECGFHHLILMGNGDLKSTAEGFQARNAGGALSQVNNAEELKTQLLPMLRADDTVLFKGPRNSGMAKAVQDLSGAIAQRCLWVNLAAIEGNIARFRRHCGGTHILAMLKAMAYGTELAQLASWMSRLGIHHIGVSSANEGAAVRRTGAGQDILVFLADREDVDNLLRYRLTPVVHSVELVEAFAQSLAGSGRVLDVHLKVDTGMHRLGVAPETALDLARRIAASGAMRLTGVCTHFAAAEDPGMDAFTRQQLDCFRQVLSAFEAEGFTGLQVHAANTAAAARFPEAHFNMVRIGLGLYGLYPSEAAQRDLELELAIGVTSRITSIQEFPAGATLGYGRTYTAQQNIRVGIVPFGYDDGLPWGLSGKGVVLVEGHPAPIVGRISMDQMQVDITGLPGISAGAEVLLYGTHNGHTIRPEEVAQRAGTISHELLTRLGERVHRIYVEP